MTKIEKVLQNRTTGPTDLPPLVRTAINQQMISHRSSAFKMVLENACQGVKRILNTNAAPMFFTCSGTGGLEAAVVNTLSVNNKVLVFSAGYYGDLFAAIARKHLGDNVTLVNFAPGTAITTSVVKDVLERETFDAVLLTHSESSTGVLNPIAELTAMIRDHSDALIIVDAISSVGSTEYHMDAWDIDVTITAPQKGLMSPPGIAIICASERAIKAHKNNNVIGSFYMDFSRALSAQKNNQTPWTPAILSIWAINEALSLIEAEGANNTYARHKKISQQCRKSVVEAGFTLFADDKCAAPGITSILLPDHLSARQMQAKLETNFGICTALGIAELEDRMVRIGHMGWVFETDIKPVAEALSHLRMHFQVEGQ